MREGEPVRKSSSCERSCGKRESCERTDCVRTCPSLLWIRRGCSEHVRDKVLNVDFVVAVDVDLL